MNQWKNGIVFGTGESRCPGEENGNSLQYSCLGNPMEKEPGELQSMGSQRVGQNLKVIEHACIWMYVPLIQVMSKLGLEYNTFEFYKNIMLWIIVFLFFFKNNSILNFNKNPGLDRCVVEFSWIWISLVLWLPKIY